MRSWQLGIVLCAPFQPTQRKKNDNQLTVDKSISQPIILAVEHTANHPSYRQVGFPYCFTRIIFQGSIILSNVIRSFVQDYSKNICDLSLIIGHQFF